MIVELTTGGLLGSLPDSMGPPVAIQHPRCGTAATLWRRLSASVKGLNASMSGLKRILAALPLSALVAAAILALPGVAAAAQAPVDLGTTENFAVLAGSTITNVGATTITGDVGLHPGTAFTGQSSVTLNGALHLTDAVALQAKDDLVGAYNDAAGRTPVTRIPTELGGTTLKPGVYDSASGTFQITGTLTLDADGDPDGVFIFLTSSTLNTASNSRVSVINSARFCRVFWKVGSSATLGTDSHFVGHIFALTSISAKTGATVEGQLLARNGAVTLENNTITNGLCASAQGAAINITKVASPTRLTSGSGPVTYTYEVSNPGTATLTDIRVTDDKISSVEYVSGDANADGQLQPSETWLYRATMTLSATTTNTGMARGIGNGVTVTDTAAVTVPVSDTPVTAGTVTGGEIPDTATPWFSLLLVGIVLMVLGAASYWRTSRRIHD